MQVLGEFKPDLGLLDLMLPGELSGSQVLERIRADHGTEPRVLVVSALVNPTTAPKLEAYGNVETLGKPFKIKELPARIQTMLDSSSRRDRAGRTSAPATPAQGRRRRRAAAPR